VKEHEREHDDVGPVPWSREPTRAEFIDHNTHLGVGARRLARLAPDARRDFLESVRARLSGLDAAAFTDGREVLAGIAR
jgi:hypothetical protein